MLEVSMPTMLYYLAKGARRYDINPIHVYQRKYWEFQAVLEGEIEARFFDRPSELRSAHLWLTAPTMSHGWFAPSSAEAEVVVFQFAVVPELLQREVEKNAGILSCDLNEHQAHRLQVLWQQANDTQKEGQSDYNNLVVDQIKGELSLMVLRSQLSCVSADKNDAAHIVDKALAWYEAQLQEQPSYELMAAAVYVSPAHLRRLFHQHLNCSPQRACESLRFQRACEMLQQGRVQYQQIAEACGYSDASSFSRSFKRYTGKSPREWVAERVTDG